MAAALALTLPIAIGHASSADAAINTTPHIGLFTDADGGCNGPFNIGVSVSGATDVSPYSWRDITVELWGADSWPNPDDFLQRWSTETFAPTITTLHYRLERCVPLSTLDEDWGEDDVYARVTIRDRATGYTEVVESPEIHGHF
ncbi:MAG TPA: hypothetical protein VH395_08170 [Jatrophihabitantaceae bacterium]